MEMRKVKSFNRGVYRLGLGAWDKRCLKQRVNHPKMDTSVLGHRVTAVK